MESFLVRLDLPLNAVLYSPREFMAPLPAKKGIWAASLEENDDGEQSDKSPRTPRISRRLKACHTVSDRYE
jgi:hypothetical protein